MPSTGSARDSSTDAAGCHYEAGLPLIKTKDVIIGNERVREGSGGSASAQVKPRSSSPALLWE